MTQKEDTKKTTTDFSYDKNIRLKNGGIKLLNGSYKRIPYRRLPKVVKDFDKKEKRDEGIVGYRHRVLGTKVTFFITVSVAKTKNVKESTPTLSLYKKQGKKVDKLYASTSKYGTLPSSKDLKSTSKESESQAAPETETNLNSETNADILVDCFVGTWYGANGFDTIFRNDNATQNLDQLVPGDSTNGFVTPYNETVDFRPISFGILNPGVLGRRQGINENSEHIHGVRYFRRVISTLEDNEKNKNNPFKAGSTIHEETGYILFMYVGKTLTRVVKSLAIPRGITVLASDDTPTITQSEDGNVIEIEVQLVSNSDPEDPNDPWRIANGAFSTRNGKISNFTQDITIKFNREEPETSTYEYGQDTPLTLNESETGHWNDNTLKKQA